jgi:hypothetical protein
MGTATYGKETNGMFDTYKEMNYLHSQKKPFFLIKMLPAGTEHFEEPSTNLVLNLKTTAWHEWVPGKKIPRDLPILIEEKLSAAIGAP